MERLKEEAILLQLIESLKEHGSWCGETQIQKATYALQQLKNVPLEYDFILYKHGPFSFELRDELAAMRAVGFITFKIMNPSYGPQIVITKRGKEIQKLFTRTLERYRDNIQFVSEKLGKKGVVELERLATALYVTKEMKIKKTNERVQKIIELKPHIEQKKAEKAVRDIDVIISEAAG